MEKSKIDGEECVICYQNRKDTAFYPCGHTCLCFDCAQRFNREATHRVCPICRNRIKDTIKIYA